MRPVASICIALSTAPNSFSRPMLLLSYTLRATITGSTPASRQSRQMSNVRGEVLEQCNDPAAGAHDVEHRRGARGGAGVEPVQRAVAGVARMMIDVDHERAIEPGDAGT